MGRRFPFCIPRPIPLSRCAPGAGRDQGNDLPGLGLHHQFSFRAGRHSWSCEPVRRRLLLSRRLTSNVGFADYCPVLLDRIHFHGLLRRLRGICLDWALQAGPQQVGNRPSSSADPVLILLDGISVVAVDLCMDPICAQAGIWTWVPKGGFFGVPIGNFVGWFLITVLCTGLFRMLEYVYPTRMSETAERISIIPVLGYGLLGLGFFLQTFIFNSPSILALLPFVTIIPVFLVVLALYVLYQRKTPDAVRSGKGILSNKNPIKIR